MLNYPFLQPDFLDALEDSGCTTTASGWEPRHLSIADHQGELAFMPLYLKHHSLGEYVFDWSWADAYQRIGRRYYPKLVTAIPFTPVTGPRARFAAGLDQPPLCRQLVDQTLALAEELGVSSWHLLFPNSKQLALFADPRLLQRSGVQYHWFNRNYHCFDDFLATLTSRKRKMLNKERRQVQAQGLTIQRLTGSDIDAQLWKQFAIFYQRTYLKRSGSEGYLTPEFFSEIGRRLTDQTLLVAAYRGEELTAAAFFLFDDQRLYGRYWGCLREYDFLHFELCYYQGIEFAIERGLSAFDAGAQGEHKIIRGFEPVETHSLHWLAEPAFAEAISRFLQDEEQLVRRYMNEAAALLPYRNDFLEPH